MKYLLILLGILAVTAMYLSARLDYTKKALERSESQKTALAKEIDRRNKNDVETSNRIAKLEKLAKESSGSFDWYADISNDPITLQLRKD